MERDIRFVSPLERALHLKSLAPLADLSKTELAALAQRARERHFGRGEPLYRGGDPVDSFHVVVEGTVRARGAEYGDRILEPGEMLGMVSMLARSEETLEAEAETETTTLEITAEDLFEVYEDHFDVLHGQIRSFCRRIMAERMKIEDGAYLAPDEEMAKTADGGELSLIDRLRFLMRGVVFKRINMDALVEIARQTPEVRVEAGTRFWSSGDPSGSMILIVRGSVRCSLPDGRAFRVGPGYPLGNIESQAGERRWYDPITETSVVALRVDLDMVFDVLEDHFEMAMDFLAQASGVIRLLQETRNSGAARAS